MSGGFGWSDPTKNAPPTCPPPATVCPVYPGVPIYYPGVPPAYYPPQQQGAGEHFYHPTSVIHATSSKDNEQSQMYSWVETSRGHSLPLNAVVGGKDADGSKICIGLAKYNGDEMPAKIIDGKNKAYVAWGGKEHEVDKYKVLVTNIPQWVKSSNGKIPKGAVKGGQTKDGETLYIGRTNVNNALTVGKVHPSHGCCYVPFGGKEHSSSNYEVLVFKSH